MVRVYNGEYGTWSRGCRKLMRISRPACHKETHFAADGWLTDPKATLQRICDFADNDFEAAMLAPDAAPFTDLGGNQLGKRLAERITPEIAWKTETPKPVRAIPALPVAGFNARHECRN